MKQIEVLTFQLSIVVGKYHKQIEVLTFQLISVVVGKAHKIRIFIQATHNHGQTNNDIIKRPTHTQDVFYKHR
jgi:hypothetical protein